MTTRRRFTRISFAAATLFGLTLSVLGGAANQLERNFVKPPDDARPWVYWFWLSGNITSNGITADLEAMKRVGIGGVLIMEVDQGAPVGPADFMGSQWRQLFQHVVNETRRLGLEVNMNNDAGWNGSGGPWIRPEESMQKVTWSETNLTGPSHFEGTLSRPESVAGFYRDISVVAFPATGAYRIPDIKSKAAFELGNVSLSAPTNLAPEMIISSQRLTNLSSSMDGQGKLIWEVPEGQWTVVRVGHTSTGMENAPAPKTGRGLECDKLSKEGIEANFRGMMDLLVRDNGISPGRANPGLVATHIDSWENGSQNWTARMREEFRQRRGYDLQPFLPVFTGRVVQSLEISERFLWDLRRTISELVLENYAGRARELAHAHGLRFTVEAYGSPCDVIPYAGQSDEPMGEFWSPGANAIETCKGMACAAHVYGKRIVGAEAFTAGDQERWREHPAVIKALGDRAFCEGINRFVFHRYALQPWAEERRPGMMMGPWGQHYERTQTWWEQTTAWHQYLARCQYLLRQGLFVADLCYLQAESPPHGCDDHRREGYDWDSCSSEVVLTRMSVQAGRVTLPDGMSYRLLVLQPSPTMTPRLLRKLKELVEAGATVVGDPPQAAPGLSGYPQCDQDVSQLAAELWGDCDGVRIKERRLGQGRILRSIAPEKALQQSGVSRDFASPRKLRYIHRQTEGTDLYFVSNPSSQEMTVTGTFRVSGKVPEFWWPDTGRIEPAAMYQETNGLTSVLLPLGPSGSVFVVFREASRRADPIVKVTRDNKAILDATDASRPRVTIDRASYGVPDNPQRLRDVRQKVQNRVDNGEYSFLVGTIAGGEDPAPAMVKTLSVDYTMDGRRFSVRAPDAAEIFLTGTGVQAKVVKATYGVLDDPKRTRDVRQKVQQLIDAGQTSFPVAQMAAGDDPAYLVVKTLVLEYTVDGKLHKLTGTDPDVIDLQPPPPPFDRVAAVNRVGGRTLLQVWKPGTYQVQTASGRTLSREVSALPDGLELTGPWQVKFPLKQGAPAGITLPQLISWSEHKDSGVKYFSGMATYTKTFSIPRPMRAGHKRLYLDLGEVEIMAQVRLNGRDLGLLWKRPFQLDITEAAKSGDNRLEVKVVNRWPNRLVGDEQLSEDCERNPDGTLKRWPEWLQQGLASPTGRYTFPMWRLWKKDDPLLPSGLLGPVRLHTAEVIPVAPR